jgi:hypothetical protein
VEDLGKKFREKYIEKKSAHSSRPQAHGAFHQRHVEVDLPKIFRKSLGFQQPQEKSKKRSKDAPKKLQTYLQEKDYKKLGALLQASFDRGLSADMVKKEAEKQSCIPLQNALLAVRKIKKLDKNLGLTSGQLLQLALFLETEWKDRIQNGCTYLLEKESGLPRILEYDPETKNSYIHLLKHGIDKLGSGFHKQVTKSILYDTQKPEIVANCRSDSDSKNIREMKITRDLQGVRGIVEGKSFIQHQEKVHGKDRIQMILKLYNEGSLRKITSKPNYLTFDEKLQAARDLAMGLEGMHSRGYVHRDLHCCNYLFHIEQDPVSKKRKVQAAIMDFGKTIFKKQCGGNLAQGSKHYTPPEGFLYQSMTADDYFAADVFALGCSFYLLYYEKEPDWFRQDLYTISFQKSSSREKEVAKKRYTEALKNGLGELWQKLAKKQLSKQSPKYRFEELFLRMMDVDPAKRPTASFIRQTLDSIQSN